ncbi:hypothetical protein [uncultured Gammaproteobacteria bacterium]|nr:hypothetical protein [uncultured Gammaproteobacteria bacterium]
MKNKNTKEAYKKVCSKKANTILKDLVVQQVRWMSEKEVSEYGWMGSAPVIEFTNGVVIIASMDDEGNDAGALFTNHKDLSVLPRI